MWQYIQGRDRLADCLSATCDQCGSHANKTVDMACGCAVLSDGVWRRAVALAFCSCISSIVTVTFYLQANNDAENLLLQDSLNFPRVSVCAHTVAWCDSGAVHGLVQLSVHCVYPVGMMFKVHMNIFGDIRRILGGSSLPFHALDLHLIQEMFAAFGIVMVSTQCIIDLPTATVLT